MEITFAQVAATCIENVLTFIYSFAVVVAEEVESLPVREFAVEIRGELIFAIIIRVTKL